MLSLKGGVYLSQGDGLLLVTLITCYGENSLLLAFVSPTDKTIAEAGTANAPMLVHFNATISNTWFKQ